MNMTAKAWAAKVKIDKLDYTETKNFCTSKDTIYRVNLWSGRKYLPVIYLISS